MMVKWEYKIKRCPVDDEATAEVLNSLGQAGWEAYEIQTMEILLPFKVSTNIIYLKRYKEER